MPSKAPKQSKESSDPSRTYNPDDVVLAKIKGYPAWPAQVIEHDKAPPKVRREKPKAKNPYLVQFFPAGDYAWQAAKDLTPLTPKEIDAWLTSGNKKKADLFEAYQVAQDPKEWNQRKADEQAEYEELLAQAGAEDDEDQLASDGGEASKDKSKKRKRASEAGKKDDKKKGKADGKKAGKKGEDGAPASKKAKTSTEDSNAELVKSWRHKLQKVFLGKGAPAAEEMPKCAEYFDAMENFEMKEEWLKESKLNKVLKRITLMTDSSIPDEDKYSFRSRSTALANKWAQLVGGAESTPQAEAPAADDAAPAENGAAVAEEKKDVDAAEPVKADEPAPEPVEEKKEEAAPVEDKPAAEEAAPMEVDEQPKENGAKEADAPAAEEKKEDAPAAAEASS
ncbi:hypothetical protein JCM6882_005224 [Rhodosporidiobolus microsporus]